MVLFPHVAMPLLIGRDASLAAVTAALDGNREILLVTQRNADVNVPTGTDLYRIGVRARLQQATRVSNGTTKVLVDGLERVQVSRFTTAKALQATKGAKAGTLIEARVDPLPFRRARAGGPQGSDTTHARIRHALSLFEDYSGLQRRLPPEVIGLLQGLDDEERIAFGIAAHLQIPLEQRQALLGAASLADLSTQLVNILGAELELLKLERKIDDQVRGSLFQNQREFFLQEQLRAIHRELGQEDGDEFEEMAKQIAARGLPEAVETRAHRELRRLKRSSPTSPDAAVSRGWLDWVLALPWTARTVDTTDLDVARTALEGDHYGLAEVKERILDHIAVLARVGKLPGPILCLVGPPGVGKTSLGRSIAHALDRKFVRMALGGVRDEAEIRGHRRTYIGAMPGRILQAMRRAESVNPVILLDEIDKLGADFRGDPAAALLEVLDPEQNSAFNDHYLEVDYDLSQVLFVTTANSLSTIPEALRDRMEIIRLPGYLEQEKLAIARRFLVPKQLVANGVPADRVTLADDVLPAIIRNYTREAGVRDLERRIARLSRKLARRPWTEKNTHTVSTDDLQAMLGTAPHPEDELNLEDQVGVANGLAYTSTGGELLEIEVSVVPGRGRLQLTGTLGDVIKESAAAALSFVRARASVLGLSPDFHRTRDIHVHLPAGATPKDGPSAGIALATALISALTGIPVRGDVAMTGEVTLRGRVLPIGGLREKGVAAHRHRIAHVIVPAANMKDLNELPDDVRAGVTWHVARTMDEVLAMALRGAVPTLRDECIVLSDAPGMVT
ncbi:endopeptidase La [Gemmatimonas sp.]|uniref:endopeptidase La n=1 Tax=Gemmatimonas sp. TaxID=1962908 RepID=UPI003F70C5F8